MDWFIRTIVAVAAGGLAVVGVQAWRWPPARRRILVGAFAGSRSLVLDAEAAALAERLLIVGRKGRFVGVAAAVVAITGAVLVLGETRSFAAPLAWIAVSNAGSQIAATLAAGVAMRRAGCAAPRRGPPLRAPPPGLARRRPAAGHALVVGGPARAGSRRHRPCLAAGVAVEPLSRRELAVSLALSAATVAAAELAARFLARAPLPAGSPAALAVCDEIRSDLATVVLAGMVGPMLLCIFVAGRILPEAGAATVVLLALPIAVMEQRRRRRVRERLWPVAASALGAGAGPGADAAS